MSDDKEGPVTKSIRLTSALILRNLVIYSSIGKMWVVPQTKSLSFPLSPIQIKKSKKPNYYSKIRFFRRLKSYESHLSTVALSNVESSRTVSQILFEMAPSDSDARWRFDFLNKRRKESIKKRKRGPTTPSSSSCRVQTVGGEEEFRTTTNELWDDENYPPLWYIIM